MILAQQREYRGNARAVIDAYRPFAQSVTLRTFAEMPNADALGISAAGMALVWQSEIILALGEWQVCLSPADSLFVAMMGENAPAAFMAYTPEVIFSASATAQPLLPAGAFHGFHLRHDADTPASPSTPSGIFHYLEFEGFCAEATAHYAGVFGAPPVQVECYENSEKIRRAIVPLPHAPYALFLRDTPESARDNTNAYDPTALLFYQNTNPLFSLRHSGAAYLAGAFARLSIGAKMNKPFTADGNAHHGSLIDKYGICWDFRADI